MYALLPLAVQGFRQPLFWLRSGFVYRIRPGFVYPLRFGVRALQASTPVPVLFTVCVTGRMRSDRSGGARRMANRNYGGNGGRVLIMAAMAAAQLN